MRRLSIVIVTLLLSALAVDATAQQVVKKRIGVYKESGNVVVAEATTTLVVDLTVEYELFEAGPYARYAQKLLGKRASFVDREEYRIIAADVAVLDEGVTPERVGAMSCDAGVEDYELPLQIDRLSSIERSAEEAAGYAAEQIFDLRRARIDLITGELGEGVFGGGLESALKEIDRLEQSYLELFYGKRKVQHSAYRLQLPVEPETTSYVVARFNAEEGIIEKDNLAGDIVMVAITPTKCDYPASEEKATVAYRYANNAEVVVALGQEVLARRILPIYEFGHTVMYLNPR